MARNVQPDVDLSLSENSIKVINKITRTPPKLGKINSYGSSPTRVSNVSNSPPNRARNSSKNSNKDDVNHPRSSSVQSSDRDRSNAICAQSVKFSDRDRSNSFSAQKRKRPDDSSNGKTCGVCESLFDPNDLTCILCDCCLLSYHARCVDLTAGELSAISFLGDKIKWYCPRCSTGAANLHKANIMFNERIGNVEQSVENLDKSVNDIKSVQSDIKIDIQNLKSQHATDIQNLQNDRDTDKGFIDINSADIAHNKQQISGIKNDLTTLNLKYDTLQSNMLETLKKELKEEVRTQINEKRDVDFPLLPSVDETSTNEPIQSQTFYQRFSSAVRGEVNELEEIKRRKNQLLIMNLKENKSATEDVLKLMELFKLLKLDKDVKINEAIRLGEKRRDQKPRFIRVTLQDLDTRRSILAKATTLRNVPAESEFANVYIKPNLTKQQNEQSKNLREDLRVRRLENQNPNTTFKITKGKIVEIPKTQ